MSERTRVPKSDREFERGLLLGGTFDRFDATGYWFNPGSDDAYATISVAVRF